MLKRVVITHWQSLREVDLTLGRLTVVVGPSNSGKSAFLRALRAAANNPRRRGYVTRGAKSATVTVYTDTHEIVYERSETTSAYRLREIGGDFGQPYTDLAGSVPQQVTAALGIAPAAAGQSLHIAAQFDPPWLLTESGAAVARTLGELTNVTVIFQAVQEANRRRAALAASLKTRQTDLVGIRAQAHVFADLPAQLSAVSTAEQAAAGAQDLLNRLIRLRRATDALHVAETVLARVAVPAVPDATALLGVVQRRARFLALAQQVRTATAGMSAADAAVDQAGADAVLLHEQLRDVLAAAGTCPTCGQNIAA